MKLFWIKNENKCFTQFKNGKREKNEKLASAMDALRDKYQKEQVWLGVTPQTLAGHVGTKIAFSRIPDKDEFKY